MARPSRTDWALGELLYHQGIKYDEIAQRLATTGPAVRQRSHRYGWNAKRETALQEASRIVTSHAGLTLAEKSKVVRTTLADELTVSANALRETPVAPELGHLSERAEVSGKLASSASKVFGWQDNQLVGLVDARALKEADVLEMEETPPVPAIEDGK
jgi:hypothetical protein